VIKMQCKIDNCNRIVGTNKTIGFCDKHRSQYRRGIIDIEGNQLRSLKKVYGRSGCKVEQCRKKHFGLGFCDRHYWQYRNRIIDENGKKLRGLDNRCRRGNMEGFSSAEERGKKFILDRYFNGRNRCKCFMCGGEFEFYQMDGHHPDPKKKTFNPHRVLEKYLPSEPEIIHELDSLIWCCAHCHLSLHSGGDDVSYEKTHTCKKNGRAIDKAMNLVLAELGGNCVDCGRKLGRRTVVFHHKNPSEKVKSVSQIMGKYELSFVFEEVRKCVILCSPCHRKRHIEEDGGLSTVNINWSKRSRLVDNSPIGKKPRDGNQGCKVVGCERKHNGLGFCKKHLMQFHKGILDKEGRKLRELYKGGFGKLAIQQRELVYGSSLSNGA